MRNTDDFGIFDGGCWSKLGFINPNTYQPINLAPGCVHKDQIVLKVIMSSDFSQKTLSYGFESTILTPFLIQ